MASRILAITATLLLAASPSLARTDLEGCTYYDSVVDPGSYAAYATRIWYVPDSGELCDFLDCGGGRAPPKTTVPGCAAYEGTATYSPSYIDVAKLTGGGDVEATTTGGDAVAQTTLPTSLPTELITAPPSTKTKTAAQTATGEETASGEDSASTTAAPGSSSGASTASAGQTSLTTTTTPDAAAMPTVGAVLAPCLIAGVAACAAIF